MTEGSSQALAPRASADLPASLKVVVLRFIRPGTEPRTSVNSQRTHRQSWDKQCGGQPFLSYSLQRPSGVWQQVPRPAHPNASAGLSGQTQSSLLGPTQQKLAMCDPEASNNSITQSFQEMRVEMSRPHVACRIRNRGGGVRPSVISLTRV